MDFIRWLIKRIFDRDPGMIIPVIFLSAVATIVGFFVHPIVGAIFLLVALLIFGTIAYVYISDAYRVAYEKFKRERSKP